MTHALELHGFEVRRIGEEFRARLAVVLEEPGAVCGAEGEVEFTC